MTRILLIEDDDETADQVASYLHARDYDVARATNGPDGLAKARADDLDVLVIDRMLPGLDGLAILATLRKSGVRTPAILLSALGELNDRVAGLRVGGDDYLSKPFAMVELVARIEALLRRPVIGPETSLRSGSLHLDLIARTARRGTRNLELLPREFQILECMVRRAGQTITRGMIFEEVWNYNFIPISNLIDVHMGRLRRKLNGPGEEELLTNVRGAGFMLNPDL